MLFILLLCSNDSWYDVGSYYRGVYGKNTSSADIPITPDVFYILNFDNILRSYGTYPCIRIDMVMLPPPTTILYALSLVTLFSLMVVNNWYVIMVSPYSKPQYLYIILSCMYNIIIPKFYNSIHFLQEGFASQVEADWLVRIYFMCFIIITLVVLQVIISFIVEAFVFKIQAMEKDRECNKHHKPLYLCGCKEGRHVH